MSKPYPTVEAVRAQLAAREPAFCALTDEALLIITCIACDLDREQAGQPPALPAGWVASP